MRKICVYVGSRANYSSIKTVMRAIRDHADLQLQTVIGAAAVLYRYGDIEPLLRADGYDIHQKVHVIVEGETPLTMAKSTGMGIMDLAMVFENLRPDIVLVVGDRFDVMAPVIAASYMNIPIAHTMGGEVSGTIDESIRHAITKFSHVHFPANEDARQRIIKLGEMPDWVFNTGCPRIDVAREVQDNVAAGKGMPHELFYQQYKGVGFPCNFNESKFLLVSQHPVTTEFGDNRKHIEETLFALNCLRMPTLMIWPNVDAGSDEISKGIRTFREKYKPEWLYLMVNLPSEIYMQMMILSACLVGNSSSAIREGAYLGVPAVNIGTRQMGRMAGDNVLYAECKREDIISKVTQQIAHGKYPSSPMYGNGDAGEKIANILAGVKDFPLQKRITY